MSDQQLWSHRGKEGGQMGLDTVFGLIALVSSPLGQRSESGAGAQTHEQFNWWRHSPQADLPSVHRDLGAGDRGHAASPDPGAGARVPEHTTFCQHLFTRTDNSWCQQDTDSCLGQQPAAAPEQLSHHALHTVQTQVAQRRTIPAEPRENPDPNVIPVRAGGSHSRSDGALARNIHMTKTNSTNNQQRFLIQNLKETKKRKRKWTLTFFLYILVHNERMKWGKSVFWIFPIFEVSKKQNKKQTKMYEWLCKFCSIWIKRQTTCGRSQVPKKTCYWDWGPYFSFFPMDFNTYSLTGMVFLRAKKLSLSC